MATMLSDPIWYLRDDGKFWAGCVVVLDKDDFMSKQNKHGNIQPLTGDEILQKGGMSQGDIGTGRKRAAMREIAGLTNALTAIVTAGGEVLIKDFGFTQKQAADWAEKTIQAARELMTNVK